MSNAAALNTIYLLQFEKGNFSILSFKKMHVESFSFQTLQLKTSSLIMLKKLLALKCYSFIFLAKVKQVD